MPVLYCLELSATGRQPRLTTSACTPWACPPGPGSKSTTPAWCAPWRTAGCTPWATSPTRASARPASLARRSPPAPPGSSSTPPVGPARGHRRLPPGAAGIVLRPAGRRGRPSRRPGRTRRAPHPRVDADPGQTVLGAGLMVDDDHGHLAGVILAATSVEKLITSATIAVAAQVPLSAASGTPSRASPPMRASCADDTDHCTGGTHHAGIIWRAGPRTGPRPRSLRPVILLLCVTPPSRRSA